ncbi:MAG: hypothetical protein AAF411_15160 [Myxococcota bacterium]
MRRLCWMAALVAACGGDDGTLAVVCVQADPSVLTSAIEARVRVVAGGTTVRDQTVALAAGTTPAGATPEGLLPMRVPIAPAGADDFRFEVELLSGAGVVSSSRLEGRFDTGEVLRYELSLDDACASVDCPAEQTCRAGACGPAAPEIVSDASDLEAVCPVRLVDATEAFALGAQGAGSWFYGYWDVGRDDDGAYDPATDFRLLEQDADTGDWVPPDSDPTAISRDLISSGSIDPVREIDEELRPMLRFIAPLGTRVTPSMQINYQDHRGCPCDGDVLTCGNDCPGGCEDVYCATGDGVGAQIYLEGEVLFDAPVPFVSRERQEVAAEIGSFDMARGERLDFSLSPGISSFFDPLAATIIAAPERR